MPFSFPAITRPDVCLPLLDASKHPGTIWTAVEASYHTGLSVPTLYRLTKRGQLKAWRDPDTNHLRFVKEVLEAELRGRRKLSLAEDQRLQVAESLGLYTRLLQVLQQRFPAAAPVITTLAEHARKGLEILRVTCDAATKEVEKYHEDRKH
jgi:hypothetical protein